MTEMERARVSLVFFVMLFMFVIQMVRGSEDAKNGQEKCFCPPSGGGSVPSTPSLSPPSGGSYSPPDDGPGMSSPPSIPSYSSPPPSDGSGSSPSIPSTPALTPPYTAPSGGRSSPSPTKKKPSPSTPSYSSPPSPSSSSSSPTAPSTPSYGTPPSTPDDGGSPSIGTTPSVPDFPPDGSPPGVPGFGTGSCDFWKSHTSSFPDILSIFSSIAGLFGCGSSSAAPAWGNDMTLHQALSNNRKDGYGSLLREGSAALLNSLVNPIFELRPHQVRNQFKGALVSNRAAAVQGAKFKALNEGHLLP